MTMTDPTDERMLNYTPLALNIWTHAQPFGDPSAGNTYDWFASLPQRPGDPVSLATELAKPVRVLSLGNFPTSAPSKLDRRLHRLAAETDMHGRPVLDRSTLRALVDWYSLWLPGGKHWQDGRLNPLLTERTLAIKLLPYCNRFCVTVR